VDLFHHLPEFTPGAELEFTVALTVGNYPGYRSFLYHAYSRVLRAEEREKTTSTHTGVAAVIEGIESIRSRTWLS